MWAICMRERLSGTVNFYVVSDTLSTASKVPSHTVSNFPEILGVCTNTISPSVKYLSFAFLSYTSLLFLFASPSFSAAFSCSRVRVSLNCYTHSTVLCKVTTPVSHPSLMASKGPRRFLPWTSSNGENPVVECGDALKESKQYFRSLSHSSCWFSCFLSMPLRSLCHLSRIPLD